MQKARVLARVFTEPLLVEEKEDDEDDLELPLGGCCAVASP